MDETSKIIDQFELVLKQQSTLRTPILYKGKTSRNYTETTSNQKLHPQNIIATVANQIKAIQNSEKVKTVKKAAINMDAYKKSTFLPVNMLQERKVPPQPPDPQKFDTQLISNTQLINIVEDAEALDVNIGMTQEFETTFFYGHENMDAHENAIKQASSFPILDISLKEPDPNPIKFSSIIEENENFGDLVKSDDSPKLHSNPDTQAEDNTQILNECIEIEDIDEIDDIEENNTQGNHQEYTQRPLSPVFNVKSKKQVDNETSLIVNLETFENFEKIAIPVIEQTLNKEEARFFINSQIIGKELILRTYMEDSAPLSPIIELECDLTISKELIPKNNKVLPNKYLQDDKINEKKNLKETENSKAKGSCCSDKSFLQDEILFSSDEEDGYQHKSYKDLPFTCALETSFYDDTEVLDKTMYVGFQTASNKSIQIGTESFSKAKSLLDSIEQDLKNEATLSELIEMCESNIESIEVAGDNEILDTTNKISIEIFMEDDLEQQSVLDNLTTDIVVNQVDAKDSVKKNISKKEKAQVDILTDSENKFEGFKTASNKPIQLSEKALEKSKKVFQNIELDEHLKVEEEVPRTSEIKENKLPTVNLKANENIELSDHNVHYKLTEEQRLDENSIKEFQDNLENSEFEDILKNIEYGKDQFVQESETDDELKLAGFKTASNKDIQISDAALAKSRNIFQDIGFNEESKKQLDIRNGNSHIPQKDKSVLPKNIGFKTASNKDISISKDALAKTKYVFNDFNVSYDNVHYKLTEEQRLDDNIIKELQDDLLNSEFEDILKNIEYGKDQFVQESEIDDELKLAEFKTASNKVIQISDAALAKSRNIFQDMDFNEEYNKQLDIKNENSHIPQKDKSDLPKSIGFKTASNKYISISKDALAKTKYIFNDFNMSDNIADSENGESDYGSNRLQIQDPTRNIDQPSTSKNIVSHVSTNKQTKLSNKAITVPSNIIETQFIKPINTNDKNKADFCGFKTASNKNIAISVDALAKGKKIFKDIDKDDYNFTKNKDNEPPFYGFEQNHKYMELVEEMLEKSQKICEKLTQSEDEIDNNAVNRKTNGDHDQISNLGFKTASNKEIQISERALAESKRIFQEINDDESLETNENNNDLKDNLQFKGFQTASNKEVKISKQALAKSRKMFQDINEDKSVEINAENEVANAKLRRFQTANNKKVKISEEVLAKSRKMFHDDKCMEVTMENDNEDADFKGFQTSNKEVEITERALAKIRKVFQEIDDSVATDFNAGNPVIEPQFTSFKIANTYEVETSEETLADSRNLLQDALRRTNPDYLNTNTSSTFKGFQTASKKEVKVSEAALAKSIKMFQDIAEDRSKYISQETKTDIKNFSKFKGFQTASNKEVKVSAKALAKSRKIFQDINDDTSVEPNNTNIVSVETCAEFKGFQTASNKKVKVSEAALVNNGKIFQDINEEKIVERNAEKVNPNESTNSTYRGFQTASKKEVKVSATALAKSRKIFENFDDMGPENHSARYDDINVNIVSNFKGFQTGNNKNVKVSEEAMAKSRKLFHDICSYDPNTKSTDAKPEASSNSKSKFNNSDIKNANNKRMSEDALLTSKKLVKNTNEDIKELKLQVEQKYGENFDDVDTQLLNNFEISMHEATPNKSKRSGSPILSCPKSKRRKVFQIPYSQKSPKKNPESEFKPPSTADKSKNAYNFSLTYKKAKLYTLRDLQKLEEISKSQDNIDPYIQQFDFENLLEFKFTDSRNNITNSVLTITELKKMFLNSVNKKLVPDGWLEIHLKLILWKLISYEIKYPNTMALTCTAKNLMDQLKYRYDKELYNAERPALRKIFEKDDTSVKTLILCVVTVYPTQESGQSPELLLTDGWYTIRTVIDKMLAKFVASGKITAGTKLVTHGAELVGSEQAVSPWEDTSSIRLKIFGNSTRRARWDARLGYHGNGAILSQLSNVALDGGKISKLRVLVTRVYPPLYVDKFEDGSTVTRSERLEHLHQMKYETERQALLEKIYEDVEKEVLEEDSQDSDCMTDSGCKRKSLDSGSQIAKLMKGSRDPNEFRSHLTSTQTALLEDHSTKERERLLQAIQTRVQDKMAALGVTLNRNVVTLFKVRLAGVDEKNGGVEVTKALLSIWRPNEAVIEMIREGTWIKILNVVPTALRYSELQISAGRQSVFSQSKYKESEKIKPYTVALKRTCYPIKDLVRNPAMVTDYNEVDTAGIVFGIDPTINDFDANKHQFQNIYLTDSEKNIISVNFWGGLKKFGFENVLDTGQIVACTNLQKRAGNSRKNIPQYRVTEFSYFTKTPRSEIARKIIDELSQQFTKIEKMHFFRECVSVKNNFTSRQKNENVTPYRFPNFDINASKHKVFIDSPLAQNSNKKDENLNLTGLDFESTFKQETQNFSPKTLLRKRQVKEKIAKLKRYGEPPPLIPMQIINKSKNAGNAYKSPLISKSDVSPSVAISVKNLPNEEEKCKVSDVDIQCSPVICLNRTYVKRSNPVKINFSKNEDSMNETADKFAEEFDYSPPLSLD